MQEGVCKWFNNERGYGFVISEGKDYFIHFKHIEMQGYKTLLDGDRVRFVAEMSPKGCIATRLSVIRD